MGTGDDDAGRPGHLVLEQGTAAHALSDWEAAAAAVLRKGRRLGEDDPDDRVWPLLTQHTLDGVAVPPLGVPEDVAGLPEAGWPGAPPFTRGVAETRSETGWDVRPWYADPDAAATAEAVHTDLDNGATSLWFTVGPGGLSADDLPTVLADVPLDRVPVVLEARHDPVAAGDALIDLLGHRDGPAAAGTSLGADPLGARLRGQTEGPTVADIVGQVVARAREAHVAALVVDGTAVTDAGGSDGQELGWTMAVGAAYLRLLTDPDGAGLDVNEAARMIDFRYAAGDEQFPTIAKFRAARTLWHRVTQLSGVAVPDRAQRQHAVTSRPMMTKYDPWVNLLRTTVAAFAAGVGGAHAVTVLPFDSALGLPDGFSRRIARNTSSVLIAESHVARVTDPAGGSHAVERLTQELARVGWEELGRIEQSGGAGAALDDGSVAHRVARTAQRRVTEVATRARPVTGVSEFPHLHEELPRRRPHPEATVPVARYGEAFEALRDRPCRKPVFLATMGPVAAHTARATFAGNLLAAGGVDAVAAGATDGADDLVEAYRREDSPPVVCLCGTDAAYAEWGAQLVAVLREAGARRVVVAGRPDDLGADDTFAVGDEALDFLERVRKELA